MFMRVKMQIGLPKGGLNGIPRASDNSSKIRKFLTRIQPSENLTTSTELPVNIENGGDWALKKGHALYSTRPCTQGRVNDERKPLVNC